MVIKPRIRGFICTTAHPHGCAENVRRQIDLVKSQGSGKGQSIKNVLVLGCSAGYGLASRVVSSFALGANTLGVSFEKEPAEEKTASAGWYNNIAFDQFAKEHGLYSHTINADAFADATRENVINIIKREMDKIDLVVYSLASPVRQHPTDGLLYRSSIKPLESVLQIKTVHVEKGEVSEISLEPATEEEVKSTVAVMGGEDWEYWIDALAEANLLAEKAKTISYTYIGSELTWPIYWDGTLGLAKADLDRASRAISEKLTTIGGKAQVAVLKAIVSQASAAIPVVPLYVALLFRVMKRIFTKTVSRIYIDYSLRSCWMVSINA
jgi:enoyl-[acyl-carrier protein] reductase/trans-2-enoyl-CoA reductase (NAD+)